MNSINIDSATFVELAARQGGHRRFVGTAALFGAVLAACDTAVVDAGRMPPLSIVETDAVISTRAELEERALGLSSCELEPSEAHSSQHEFFGVRVYLPPSYEQIILEPAENPSVSFWSNAASEVFAMNVQGAQVGYETLRTRVVGEEPCAVWILGGLAAVNRQIVYGPAESETMYVAKAELYFHEVIPAAVTVLTHSRQEQRRLLGAASRAESLLGQLQSATWDVPAGRDTSLAPERVLVIASQDG